MPPRRSGRPSSEAPRIRDTDFRLFLAWSGGGECRATLEQYPWDTEQEVNLLVSFFYLQQYRKVQSLYRPARTMLDSGAFSAWSSGKEIDMDALIAESKNPYWNESVALDVVGNPTESLRNAERMHAQGSNAFPVFHYGEPLEVLEEYCRRWPRVGLSCRLGETTTQSMNWLSQCFSRCWPHKFHSFGWVSETMLMTFPFFTADTASWNNSVARFGRWKCFGSEMGTRGIRNLRAEMEDYFRMETRVRSRWSALFRQNFTP